MDIDTFMSLVKIEGEHWIWTGRTMSQPNRIFPIVGASKNTAQRYSYDAFVAPVQKGYKCFTVCGEDLCVNPAHIMHARKRPIENRFWRWVTKTATCWTWKGAKRNEFGYGALGNTTQGESSYLAHRVSWVIHFGAIPDGLSVLHKCDNPPCVRPDHLFLGTAEDNCRDMLQKGRNSNTKYSQDVIDLIREMHKNKVKTKDIALKTGISHRYVKAILYEGRRQVRQPTKESDKAA